MSLDDAVRSSVRTFAARPTKTLPFYVAGLAVPVITRVLPFVGILGAYLLLRGSGRLDAVREVLEPAAPIRFDDTTDPEESGGEEIDGQALEEALLDLLTPGVIAIAVVTVLLAILVFVAFQAAVSAGRYHAVFALLRGEAPTRAGVDGVFARTRTYVGLQLAEILAYVVVIGAPVAWIAVGILVFETPLFAIPAVLAVIAAIPLLIVFRLVLAFARPAVAVEDLDAIPALYHGWDHVRGNPFQTIGYGILAVGLTGVANVIGGTFSQVGAATASTLVPMVFVFPVLDLVKTTLFARDRDVALEPPDAPTRDRLPRLKDAARSGLATTGQFVRHHPGAHLASVFLFAGGIAIGLWAAGQVEDLFVASIEQRLEGSNPLVMFAHFATNNWTVAAGQSLAGFVAGVPAAVSLLFNGANIGFVYGIETDPEVLVAFIAPHGLLEIPALLISGALGLHLGRVGWAGVRGEGGRDRIATAMDEAFQVLIGLAVLLVVAAAIEAAFSPYYWRLLGL